jgi:hypothetical protein
MFLEDPQTEEACEEWGHDFEWSGTASDWSRDLFKCRRCGEEDLR